MIVDHIPTPSKRTRAEDDIEVGRIVQNVIYQKSQSHHSSRFYFCIYFLITLQFFCRIFSLGIYSIRKKQV